MSKINRSEEFLINSIIENYNNFSEAGKDKIRSFIESEHLKEIFNTPMEIEEWSLEEQEWFMMQEVDIEWNDDDFKVLCDNCKEKAQ